jgi:hypothetical protein
MNSSAHAVARMTPASLFMLQLFLGSKRFLRISRLTVALLAKEC